MNLTLSEEFLSFQGEGSFMGRRAYFIRTYGCPVKCSWCDTKDSWLGQSYSASIEDIVDRVLASKAEIAVITGGEPCLQDLSLLVEKLKENSIKVHLETSGVLPNKWDFDWIVLSPKLGKKVDETFLESAKEMKFILGDIEEMKEYNCYLKEAKNVNFVWLHPQSQKLENKELMKAIASYVVENGEPYRAGCQLHKIYNFR
ncbi:MAG: 7-carboxy-7-deazaguanine synthase QueE [Opitutales bacterium]